MFERNTYMEIYPKNIFENTKKVLQKYADYEYYIGVVKADFYAHKLESAKSILDAGINYLATATLDEALEIREVYPEIPILCLGVVPKDFVKKAIEKHITLTITSLNYANEIKDLLNENVKVHIKLNTGMNRLGIKKKEELIEVFQLLTNSKAEIEGIYSHIYEALNPQTTKAQFEKYKELLDAIDSSNIKIKHLAASETVIHYPKPEYLNGCRLGIIMYGFASDDSLGLKSTFKLKSEIIQINELEEGETLGYDATFTATKPTRVAVVAIGYADGIIRKNKGRKVYINDKPYSIIGNICMDMLFVEVDETVKVHDMVEIYRDNSHVEEVAAYIGSIPHEILVSIDKRVKRVYKND